ncbi:Trk system potassium transporter TrkA [Parvularcula sp. LCG005]|uniref:Trk system potassium transporter TrkA n=1 Tax=Parvularcula sp. LCG005 TaxID=3078805 RepID=UPI002942DAA4|nr:Trk system potassium transporter TrkA [Parvularcula sp. LCG005]WOI52348.1 Trk system potassium transporter TrkA [Parvularcula sp. LCG005]
MRAIVCGAGRVGYGIAARLAQEKADVTVIDQAPALIRQVTERLDVRGVVGSGSYPDVLQEAGARDADMMIAVTASDEVNIVACQMAHSVFGIPTKLARIRAQSYLDRRYADVFSRDNIPIDVVISPEKEVADAILQRLTTPAAFDIKTFAEGRIWAVGIRLSDDCPILGTPLGQVRELFPDLKITIAGVSRGNRFFRTSSEDQLQTGDEVYFVAERSRVDRAIQILGQDQARARRIIIVGGGNIGFDVAAALESMGQSKIRMIERDPARAAQIAEKLERTIVLQGSGLDREILREAGVADAEAVVALTNSDETNLLSAIIAKREGARRSNILVNEPEYADLSRSVGIDRVIDPRAITISTILHHVRRGRIKSVYSILDGKAELVEAIALETSDLVGKPLSEANLPSGVIIGSVMRGDEVILPRAQTVIEAGDLVVLLTLKEHVSAVEKLFRVSVEYF